MPEAKVLCVAEKPNIASAVAQALGKGRNKVRKAAIDVHEFEGKFLGAKANFFVTAVTGHVHALDFSSAYRSWDVDPVSLFGAPVEKRDADGKVGIIPLISYCEFSLCLALSSCSHASDDRGRQQSTLLQKRAVATILCSSLTVIERARTYALKLWITRCPK